MQGFWIYSCTCMFVISLTRLDTMEASGKEKAGTPLLLWLVTLSFNISVMIMIVSRSFSITPCTFCGQITRDVFSKQVRKARCFNNVGGHGGYWIGNSLTYGSMPYIMCSLQTRNQICWTFVLTFSNS